MNAILWVLLIGLLMAAAIKGAKDSRRLLPVLFTPIALAVAPTIAFALQVASSRLPLKFDAYLHHVDLALFSMAPSFVLARDLEGTRVLAVVTLAYTNIMAVGVAIFFVHLLRNDGQPLRAFILLIVGPLLGYSIYYLVPACGPKYAFSSFPTSYSDLPVSPMSVLGPPNAMPSVHFSLGLFCYWLCRRWWFLRIPAAIYALAIGMATLALGEHYGVDLVVALPFAGLCLSLTYGKFRWSAACAVALFISLFMLRWDVRAILDHPILARSFALFEVALGFGTAIVSRPSEEPTPRYGESPAYSPASAE